MSNNAVDVALVGAVVGTSAVAGVGFAGPYWGLAFAIDGGVAGGTIALVSQRYGAAAHAELGDAVWASVLLVVVVTIPVSAAFWTHSAGLVGVPLTGVTVPEIALPAIGLWGLCLAFLAETAIPAAINHWRFRSGKWKVISEAYRPEAPADD